MNVFHQMVLGMKLAMPGMHCYICRQYQLGLSLWCDLLFFYYLHDYLTDEQL